MLSVQSWKLAFVGVAIIITVPSLTAEEHHRDLIVHREEISDGWTKTLKNNHNYCYIKSGVPQICWNALTNNYSTDIYINCTLQGTTIGTVLSIYAGDNFLHSCNNNRTRNINMFCSTLVPQADKYANMTFSCRFRTGLYWKAYQMNFFTLTDTGIPSKPVKVQNNSQLSCAVERPRSGSVLELIKLANGDILETKNYTSGNTLQVLHTFSEGVHETFLCRHKYLSGKHSEVEINVQTDVLTDEGRKDDNLHLILYGIIAIVLSSVICCIVYVCCRRSKKRKEKLISSASSSKSTVSFENSAITQDIYSTPVPRSEREVHCNFTVPVPKSRGKVTEEYATVVPKNRRPNYAEPAYAEPCDFQPDPVYMDIGSALYASINGSHHYDNVGPTISNSSEEVQYASLAESPCYSNSETIHRNARKFASTNTSNPIYATVKPSTAPKPMPKPRLKPCGTGRYVEMS